MLTSKQIITKCFVYFSVATTVCLFLNVDILKEYIFLDANELIYTASRDSKFHNLFIENGRHLLGYWSEYLYANLCKTITSLKWVRLATLICSVIFSCQIFRFLISQGLNQFESFLFAITILALPSFTIYYSWSATAQIPLLLILNFYAGTILLKALSKKQNLVLMSFISFTIVLITLFTYQSVVMAFILPFIFKTVITNKLDYKSGIYLLTFTFISFVSFYILFKLLTSINNLDAAGRTSLNLFSLPKKIIKFYLFECVTLIKNSGFLMFSKTFLILGSMCFLGFFYYNIKKNKSWIFKLILLAVLPLSYAPNLLSSQSYFSLRTIAVTAIIICFYQFWMLKTLCNKYEFLKKVLVIVPFTLLILSYYNQHNYVAGIQYKEYKVLKNVFKSTTVISNEKLIIVIPEHGFLKTNGFLVNDFSDEFGNLSSTKPWSTPHLFSQLKWEDQQKEDNTLEVFSPKNISITYRDTLNKNLEIKSINLVNHLQEAFSK